MIIHVFNFFQEKLTSKADNLNMDADEYVSNNMGSYLRACKDGEAAIRRWRLMVLGPSGDGKTSLINRLLGKGFTDVHVITNGLETDCKVEITHCDREWREYVGDHLDLLDESVTQGIEQFIKVAKADPIPQKRKASSTPNVKFDEMMDTKEKEEAKIRLETIFKDIRPRKIKRISRLQNSSKPGSLKMPGNFPNQDVDNEILKFILSIWDLGGQVLYYALHHIFLRWHCVYILVVNLSRPLHSYVPSHELPPHSRQKNMKYYQSIEFWLNMVFSHMVKVKENVKLPSVLLVGTHKDVLHDECSVQDKLAKDYFSELQSLLLNKAHFQQVHSQFIAVDSRNGDPENYSKLRLLISELVEQHCNQSRLRPIRWLRLEKKLHELKTDKSLPDLDQHLVSYNRAMEYARQFHIHTHDDLKFFLEYHHLTADITYCSGEGLWNYIVPHPQWLIDVLRALITLEQFYPKTQKCIQEMRKLQNEGILKTNGSLLNEVWKHFLQGDSQDMAKQYLLNLMSEFQLAVKYEEGQYIIPCLLPICPSKNMPEDHHQRERNLPTLYYMFHSSAESFSEVSRGDEAYDNFLPHGLFQKLIAKCSKQGWTWTKDRYQDSVSFITNDILLSLQARSTWIVLNVFALNEGIAVNYNAYESTVSALIKQLLHQYHPNMWFERAVNPCARGGHECLFSIGSSSFDKDCPNLHGVTCSDHIHSLTTPQFNLWFCSRPCRVLTQKDLKRVGNELTDKHKQLVMGLELSVPDAEITAINENNPEIRLASFKMLMSWYNDQIYKVKAFDDLCTALKRSRYSGLMEKCLNVHDF